jgi:hypothetical protein
MEPTQLAASPYSAVITDAIDGTALDRLEAGSNKLRCSAALINLLCEVPTFFSCCRSRDFGRLARTMTDPANLSVYS